MNPAVEPLVPGLWTTLSGVAQLHGQAFVDSVALKDGALIAVVIVLAAGLSQAIGQSFVLFANKVSQARFAASLLISALLFVFGYAFYTLSTWAVSSLSGARLPLGTLWIVLAVSYVPLLFSIFEAIPYVGIAIMWSLRVWQLLATLVGVSAVARVSIGDAFVYAGLGWLGLAIGQQTFGRPISRLGARIMDAVAGVQLQSDEEEAIEGGPGGELSDKSDHDAGRTASATGAAEGPEASARRWSTLAYIAVVVVLFGLVLLAARPLQQLVLGWSQHLPAVLRLPFDLAWIAVVAFLVAAILSPLETLGWWAGWYGEEIKPPPPAVSRARSRASGAASRYIIYLDGISQSGARYTPDVEKFLDALAPTLPKRAKFIRGLMVYSVFNRPLDDDPLFSGFWNFVDSTRIANPASVLGLFVNIRNMLIVGVSTDPRYGPIYNYGIAKVLYDGLIANGYVPGSGVPVTLIGYSGGAQMSAGAAHLLRRALEAPIDLITLGGVMSGSGRFLDLEHVYHQIGDNDGIQKLGPLLFASRWKIMWLSYWNRAERLGRISTLGLGPVSHMEPGGMFDPVARLPDGRTHLEQTLDNISRIVRGQMKPPTLPVKRLTNYGHYIKAPWNRPEYYPVDGAVDAARYLPLGTWLGRLVLPKREERDEVRGAWFEVHHADEEHAHLVGQRVKLRWQDDTEVHQRVTAVTRDVFFSADAEYSSTAGGTVCPTRLNQWQLVDPLESLAGARPLDDVAVMLVGPVVVDEQDGVVLQIAREPVQITGRYYGAVRFIGAEPDYRYRVAHFNRATRAFDGSEEVVSVPPAVTNPEGRAPSSMREIERSPLNEDGWYIYGAPDASGAFVIQSMAPRGILCAQPLSVVSGLTAERRYVRKEAWADLGRRKGTAASTYLAGEQGTPAVAPWQEGDTALLIHVFGGVGGEQREAAAGGPIYLGHFAYGEARVVRDPVTDDLRFDIVYHQVYAHNEDGLTSGSQHWSRYMGDRQFGWLGERPVCDILLRHNGFTSGFPLDRDRHASVLDALALQLEAMSARYRIANGTGCAYVGPANNCAQDSNRALFAVLRDLQHAVSDQPSFAQWESLYPEQVQRFEGLARLAKALARKMQTLGSPRRDWTSNEFSMGSTMEDHPLQQVWMALGSWRMALPRFASDTIVGTFLDNGASAWVLFYDQVGGDHPEIEPIAPLTL